MRLRQLDRFVALLLLLAALCMASCGKKPAPESEKESAEVLAAPEGDFVSENEVILPPPAPSEPEVVIDTAAKVAILGYHVFSEKETISRRVQATTIFIGKFREQMQILKDNEIPVITMSDYLAWRRSEKNIPPFSVIITIDDGYVSTYNRAFPIMKEFGFPFTIYPYTNFFGGAGKTLSKSEINEMLENRGELGSHGISHGFLNRQGRRSDEVHAAFLKKETAGSREIFREKLGVDAVTFSFPYGAYDDRLIQACLDAGYQAMVTVKGKKVGWETDLRELGRYIVHGEDDRIFDWAISSKVPGGLASGNNIMAEVIKDEVTGEETPLVSVSPRDGRTIHERQPVIKTNLSKIEGLDPGTLSMSISGVGAVNAVFDEETREFSYRPVQRLRLPTYWVNVRFKREGKTRLDLVRWRFSVDAVASYLTTFESSEPAEEPAETPATIKP